MTGYARRPGLQTKLLPLTETAAGSVLTLCAPASGKVNDPSTPVEGVLGSCLR